LVQDHEWGREVSSEVGDLAVRTRRPWRRASTTSPAPTRPCFEVPHRHAGDRSGLGQL